MSSFFPKALLTSLSLFLVVGCASTGGATSATQTKHTIPFTFAVSEAGQPPLGSYQKIIVDQVALTAPDDTHWQYVSDDFRTEIARLTHHSFELAARTRLALADQPEAGVMRLKLTVEDLKLVRPLPYTANHFEPVGPIRQPGRNLSDVAAPKPLGSVTIHGELRDAQTNVLLAAFDDQEAPDPHDTGALLDQDKILQVTLDKAAKKFASALGRARAETQPCAEQSKPERPASPQA